MTITLFFTLLSLGAWIISNNLKFLKNITGGMFFVSMLALISTDLLSSFNLTYGLFLVAKDLLILGVFSFIMNIAKNNLFAQLGLYIAGMIFLYNQMDSKNDLQAYNTDREWELLVKTEKGKIPARLNDIILHYKLTTSEIDPKDFASTELDDYISLGIPPKYEAESRKIFSLIEKTKGVSWVEYNEKLYRILPEPGIEINAKKLNNTNDPLTSRQWSMQALNMDQYFKFIYSNALTPTKKVKLFILDTGIDGNHEDLEIAISSENNSNYKDTKGHGTHCAGIAAGISNNGKGISSMVPGPEWVEVHSIKVFNEFGLTTQKKVINGIIEAVDKGADVINMSLGARSYQLKEKAYAETIQYAIDHGTIIVAAAGNSNDDARNFVPAKLDDVITVTAIDSKQSLAYFSNYITNVTYGISAPGQDILSTLPNGQYDVKSGTSMAAPHVAGLISVMKALRPDLGIEEIHTILKTTGNNSNNSIKSGKIINPLGTIQYMMNPEL
jgi:thermitase